MYILAMCIECFSLQSFWGLRLYGHQKRGVGSHIIVAVLNQICHPNAACVNNVSAHLVLLDFSAHEMKV